MGKIKVGILTFSDGRSYVHEDLLPVTQRYQEDLVLALENTGQVEVFAGTCMINSNTAAKEEASRLRDMGVELTIFNYAIWCYPQYSAVAGNFAPGPYLLFCNLHPSECGMVGMLAAAGTMDQLGYLYERIWGSISDTAVLESVMRFIKAAHAVKSLRGQTYGNFGGRPMGMYTAVANLDAWQSRFGIDVEDIEQSDIIRYGEYEDKKRIENARKWLEAHVGRIAYDGVGLTPEKLDLQIRSYYGLRRLIDERGLDFIGIKAHGDLTETFVTMDVAEAFLNDPYDWDGPHEPIVAATESDMDGALTMQLMKLITGQPVLFADVRHYDRETGLWFFSNSGTHATFFAGRSYDPVVNLKNVVFYPERNYYPAGGASVQHFAAAGAMTFARLARKRDRYVLTVLPGEIVSLPPVQAQSFADTVTPEWPVAFAKLQTPAERFLSEYPCNHIHGIYGEWTHELKLIAKLLNLDLQIL